MESQKTLSLTSGSIKFEAFHNKKAKNAQILMTDFKTTETELLDELFIRFKTEKVFEIGTNANNAIANCWTSNQSIYLVVPESNILKVIALVYNYLLASKISAVAARDCLSKDQSYTKLHADIQNGFTVTVTGKCMQIVRKLNTDDKSIAAFIKNLNSAKVRSFPDIKTVKKTEREEWIKSHPISASPTATLYMCLFLGKFEFVLRGTQIRTDDCTFMNMKHHLLEHAGVAQAYLKAYLNQCGNKRSKPAANDTDGSKMIAGNELALKNLNVIVGMICKLHGFKFTPFTMDTWNIDKAAVAEMKHILKAPKK